MSTEFSFFSFSWRTEEQIWVNLNEIEEHFFNRSIIHEKFLTEDEFCERCGTAVKKLSNSNAKVLEQNVVRSEFDRQGTTVNSDIARLTATIKKRCLVERHRKANFYGNEKFLFSSHPLDWLNESLPVILSIMEDWVYRLSTKVILKICSKFNTSQ